jgi:hypothetical protein
MNKFYKIKKFNINKINKIYKIKRDKLFKIKINQIKLTINNNNNNQIKF